MITLPSQISRDLNSFVSFSLDPNTNQVTILITLTTQQEEFPSVGLTGALQSQLMDTGGMFGLRVLEITRRGKCYGLSLPELQQLVGTILSLVPRPCTRAWE